MNKQRFISRGKLNGYAIINPKDAYLSVTRRINSGLYLQIQMPTRIGLEYNLLDLLGKLGKKPRVSVGMKFDLTPNYPVKITQISTGLWEDDKGINQLCLIITIGHAE